MTFNFSQIDFLTIFRQSNVSKQISLISFVAIQRDYNG